MRDSAATGVRSRPRAARFMPQTSKISAKSDAKWNESEVIDPLRPVVLDPHLLVADATPEELLQGQMERAQRKPHLRPSRISVGLVRLTESWSFSSRDGGAEEERSAPLEFQHQTG